MANVPPGLCVHLAVGKAAAWLGNAWRSGARGGTAGRRVNGLPVAERRNNMRQMDDRLACADGRCAACLSRQAEERGNTAAEWAVGMCAGRRRQALTIRCATVTQAQGVGD